MKVILNQKSGFLAIACGDELKPVDQFVNIFSCNVLTLEYYTEWVLSLNFIYEKNFPSRNGVVFIGDFVFWHSAGDENCFG